MIIEGRVRYSDFHHRIKFFATIFREPIIPLAFYDTDLGIGNAVSYFTCLIDSEDRIFEISSERER